MKKLINYYSKYKIPAIFSIIATGLFEIIDLIVPYIIGQILNLLSDQKIDLFLVKFINNIANITNINSENTWLSLTILLIIIFIISVLRSPIQPWLTAYFHWGISIKARRDYSQKGSKKY